MREYTEIQIVDSEYKISEIFRIGDLIFFDFEESELLQLIGGRPIKMNEDKILFQTQGYYDLIKLSKANSGTKLKLCKNFKKTKSIADAVIIKKYYQKASKQDFRLTEELNDLNSVELELDVILTNKEKEMLDLGITPLSMDEKWISFVENNVIKYLRSWTGKEIYRGFLKQNDDGNWLIYKLQCFITSNDVDKDQERYEFKDFLQSHLKWMKLLIE